MLKLTDRQAAHSSKKNIVNLSLVDADDFAFDVMTTVSFPL